MRKTTDDLAREFKDFRVEELEDALLEDVLGAGNCVCGTEGDCVCGSGGNGVCDPDGEPGPDNANCPCEA